MRQADSVRATEEVRSRRSERTGFRPDIEGLRAVAVLGVVLFHAEVPGVGGGFVGVDVFFVISGFLITGLLWREVSTAGTVRLRRFYGARARRLLPASATVGVATAIGSAVLLPPLQARTVLLDGIASALYVGNYGFAVPSTGYLAADTPRHHQPQSDLHRYRFGWHLSKAPSTHTAGKPGRMATPCSSRRCRCRSVLSLLSPAVVPAPSKPAILSTDTDPAIPSWQVPALEP